MIELINDVCITSNSKESMNSWIDKFNMYQPRFKKKINMNDWIAKLCLYQSNSKVNLKDWIDKFYQSGWTVKFGYWIELINNNYLYQSLECLNR